MPEAAECWELPSLHAPYRTLPANNAHLLATCWSAGTGGGAPLRADGGGHFRPGLHRRQEHGAHCSLLLWVAPAATVTVVAAFVAAQPACLQCPCSPWHAHACLQEFLRLKGFENAVIQAANRALEEWREEAHKGGRCGRPVVGLWAWLSWHKHSSYSLAGADVTVLRCVRFSSARQPSPAAHVGPCYSGGDDGADGVRLCHALLLPRAGEGVPVGPAQVWGGALVLLGAGGGAAAGCWLAQASGTGLQTCIAACSPAEPVGTH